MKEKGGYKSQWLSKQSNFFIFLNHFWKKCSVFFCDLDSDCFLSTILNFISAFQANHIELLVKTAETRFFDGLNFYFYFRWLSLRSFLFGSSCSEVKTLKSDHCLGNLTFFEQNEKNFVHWITWQRSIGWQVNFLLNYLQKQT